MAKAMKDSCRGFDHVARIGEDRFALLLPGMRREDLSRKIAKLTAIEVEAERQVSSQAMILSPLEKRYIRMTPMKRKCCSRSPNAGRSST